MNRSAIACSTWRVRGWPVGQVSCLISIGGCERGFCIGSKCYWVSLPGDVYGDWTAVHYYWSYLAVGNPSEFSEPKLLYVGKINKLKFKIIFILFSVLRNRFAIVRSYLAVGRPSVQVCTLLCSSHRVRVVDVLMLIHPLVRACPVRPSNTCFWYH